MHSPVRLKELYSTVVNGRFTICSPSSFFSGLESVSQWCHSLHRVSRVFWRTQATNSKVGIHQDNRRFNEISHRKLCHHR